MNTQNDKPTFYRQRFLLSLLKFINIEITRTELQKHSFLFSQQSAMGYDFIPYYFGCYSFQLSKDLEDLYQLDFVEIVGEKIKLRADNPIVWLKTRDRNNLFKYPEKYKQLKGNDLIAKVYEEYPYYAINSTIINRVCPPQIQREIQTEKENIIKTTHAVYTIGYEGISLEAYINKLIRNDIKLLCDVRKNPLSRKFGFSYKALNNILPKLGIDYVHIPQLGIESNKRQNLNGKEDYKILFNEYKTTLPNKEKALDQVLNLYKQYQRIALTCFEKSHHECHRHCVSNYLFRNHKTQTIHL